MLFNYKISHLIYHLARLVELKNIRVVDHIKWLAPDPNKVRRRFKGYIIGGVRFHMKDSMENFVFITTKPLHIYRCRLLWCVERYN